MTTHNKAVRDKIPEIIKSSGRNCKTKRLSDSEFLVKLEEKLAEELQEYMESKSVEELADIIEVIYRIAELGGTTKEQLEKTRLSKSQQRGGFKDNLLLIDIGQTGSPANLG